MTFENDISSQSDDDESSLHLTIAKLKESNAYLNGKADAQAELLRNPNITTANNTNYLELAAQVKILQQEQYKLKESIIKVDVENLLAKHSCLLAENGELLKQVLSRKEQENTKDTSSFIQEIKHLTEEKRKVVQELSISTKINSDLNEYSKKESKEKENSFNALKVQLSKKDENIYRLMLQIDELKYTISNNQQTNENSVNCSKKGPYPEKKNVHEKNTAKAIGWLASRNQDLTCLFKIIDVIDCPALTSWLASCNKDLTRLFKITDVIDCPVLTSGVHQWQILIHKRSDDLDSITLGVFNSEHNIDSGNSWSRNWGIDNIGCSANRFSFGGHMYFKEGAVVTFILDLTDNGTLSFSVDGECMREIFKDMKFNHVMSNNEQIGFIPAASISNGVEIRFLGFEPAGSTFKSVPPGGFGVAPVNSATGGFGASAGGFSTFGSPGGFGAAPVNNTTGLFGASAAGPSTFGSAPPGGFGAAQVNNTIGGFGAPVGGSSTFGWCGTSE